MNPIVNLCVVAESSATRAGLDPATSARDDLS